jgi:hypothetical protein
MTLDFPERIPEHIKPVTIFALGVSLELLALGLETGTKASGDFSLEVQAHESFLRSDFIWKRAGGETL